MNKANICFSFDKYNTKSKIRLVTKEDEKEIERFKNDETDEYPDICLRKDFDTIDDFIESYKKN